MSFIERQEELIKSGLKLYVVLSGGGSNIIPLMLDQGGASAYFIGASVPYSMKALKNFLGADKIDSYCSETMARCLAVKAFEQAKSLADWPPVPNMSHLEYANDDKCWGIACTAALAKAGERKDRVNRAFIAAHGYKGTFSDIITFDHNWVNDPNISWSDARKSQEKELSEYIYFKFLNNILVLP